MASLTLMDNSESVDLEERCSLRSELLWTTDEMSRLLGLDGKAQRELLIERIAFPESRG